MITVIIPNYNNATYIRACIHSCIIQNLVKQIIVIDDGSTDDSINLIQNLQCEHPQIELIKSTYSEPKGAAYCRNLGLKSARGKYIAFLDSDDVFEEGRFEAALTLLESNPSIKGVYDNVQSWNKNFENRRPDFDITMPTDVASEKLFEHLLFNGQTFISIIGLILRKEVAKAYQMDENLAIGEDSDYIWKLALHHRLVHSGDEGSKIKRRLHERNITHNSSLWDQSRSRLFQKWYVYAQDNGLDEKIEVYFLRKTIYYTAKEKLRLGLAYKCWAYIKLSLKHPFWWRYRSST
jgi:glycosyltransferase involved in cell wall biosynthesis